MSLLIQSQQTEKASNESVKLHNQTFLADLGEKFLLDGEYKIKTNYINRLMRGDSKVKPELEETKYFHAKSVFRIGNILYKSDEPNVFDLIDLIIEGTHSNQLVESMDRSKCGDRKQMRSGTICPTKEVAFIKNNKVFTLYGRYIYGYDKNYIDFMNDKPNAPEDDSDSWVTDDEEDCEENRKEKEPKLSDSQIIIPVVAWENPLKGFIDDYTYCFTITDEKSGVLIAFAAYR